VVGSGVGLQESWQVGVLRMTRAIGAGGVQGWCGA
jgi:hypothetical protein